MKNRSHFHYNEKSFLFTRYVYCFKRMKCKRMKYVLLHVSYNTNTNTFFRLRAMEMKRSFESIYTSIKERSARWTSWTDRGYQHSIMLLGMVIWISLISSSHMEQVMTINSFFPFSFRKIHTRKGKRDKENLIRQFKCLFK